MILEFGRHGGMSILEFLRARGVKIPVLPMVGIDTCWNHPFFIVGPLLKIMQRDKKYSS